MDFRRRTERCSKNDDLSCYCLFYPAPELSMGPKASLIVNRGHHRVLSQSIDRITELR